MAACVLPAQAQSAARGQSLYGALPGVPGLGSCVACHGDPALNLNGVLRGGAGAGLISRTIMAVGAMGYLRQFLGEGDLADIAAYLAAVSAQEGQRPAPQVGPTDRDFAAVDTVAQQHLARSGAPGLTLVIAAGDRIVYAQGYGSADRDRQAPASPWLEQRLADTSAVLTAVAIMRLVEQGRLALEDPAWAVLAPILPEPADARVRAVTLRHLLTHSWGADPARTPEPAAGWLLDGGRPLTECRDLLALRLSRMALDHAPGSRQSTNRLGHCWLGLIAEAVDGRSLAEQLGAMLGAEALSGARVRLGDVDPAERTAIEVAYHDAADSALVPPVPGQTAPGANVRPSQGGYSLRGYGGAAGLVASPLTLTRFVQRLLGVRAPALLADGTRATLWALAAGGERFGAAPAWSGAGEYRFHASGQLGGTQTAVLATPRVAGGVVWTIVAMLNGDSGTGAAALLPGLVEPVLAEIDRLGAARLAAKPEIAPDELIAPGSSAEAAFAELLFDWGERSFPALLPAPATAAGLAQGYRFRYYAATDTYVGVRDGRVALLQPSVGGQVTAQGAMGDYLPQVLRSLPHPRPLQPGLQRAIRR